MADKKIKLTINEQAITCNFGVNYFYKHFNEITGIDMLVEGLKDIATTKMFDLVAGIYCAGYFAETSVKKEEPKIGYEDFKNHVLGLDEAGAAEMVTNYLNVINPTEEKQPGEQVAQTTS